MTSGKYYPISKLAIWSGTTRPSIIAGVDYWNGLVEWNDHHLGTCPRPWLGTCLCTCTLEWSLFSVTVINSGLVCLIQRNPIIYWVYSRLFQNFDLWSADRKLSSASILTKCKHATGMYIHTYAYIHASQSTLVHDGTGESVSDRCLAGLASQIPIQRACVTGPVYHTHIACVAERMLDSWLARMYLCSI